MNIQFTLYDNHIIEEIKIKSKMHVKPQRFLSILIEEETLRNMNKKDLYLIVLKIIASTEILMSLITRYIFG